MRSHRFDQMLESVYIKVLERRDIFNMNNMADRISNIYE